jgi:phytoene synthase
MTRNTSFYYSFLVLPPDKRRAITAVFDFCRAVDDAVDLETDAGRIAEALSHWRSEVGKVFSGQPPDTPQGRALQPFVTPCHLPREQFDALVDGVAMDAAGARYRTFADLEPYCHRVASSVGLMCAEIFEYRDARVLEYARDLGVALQLTNILRDVAVDFRNGRRYLPDEDLARAGCSWEDIEREVRAPGRGVQSAQVRAALAIQAGRAREYFARAAALLPATDRRRFVPAEIMRAVYWALLVEIERSQFDVFSRVVRIRRPKQAMLALRTWWVFSRS